MQRKQIPIILLPLGAAAIFMLLLANILPSAAASQQPRKEQNHPQQGQGRNYVIEHVNGVEISSTSQSISGRLRPGVKYQEAPFIVDGVPMDSFHIEPRPEDHVDIIKMREPSGKMRPDSPLASKKPLDSKKGKEGGRGEKNQRSVYSSRP